MVESSSFQGRGAGAVMLMSAVIMMMKIEAMNKVLWGNWQLILITEVTCFI